MILLLLKIFITTSRFAPKCSYQDIPKWIVYRTNSSFAYFEWEVPFIEDTIKSHEVQLAKPSSSWCSSLSIGMINWDNPTHIQDFHNDTYWDDFITMYSGAMRTCLIQIETGMVYRARVRSYSSSCGASAWSEIIFFSSPKNLSAFLEVQGTGYHNPVSSYINLNNTYLFKGSFSGFLLSVIERCTLKEVFQSIYDTRADPDQASMLSSKLREFDSNHLIILISSGAWEPYFTKDLSDAIWELGGYLTLTQTRVTPIQPSYFFEVEPLTGQPYALVTIPYQKHISGQSFEVLRNLSRYFNYSDELYNAIPPARIRVNLLFDTFRQFFTIEGKRVFRINQV